MTDTDNIAPKLKSKINEENIADRKPERLPFPLKYMNRKEKLVSVRSLIVFDRLKRLNKSESKVKYGEASWEPSFWPKDDLKWSDLPDKG